MKRHQNKEINKAIEYAIKKGWKIEKTNSCSHAWGKMYCPYKDKTCRDYRHCIASIYSTPRNSTNHASQLKRIVDRCIHEQYQNEEENSNE